MKTPAGFRLNRIVVAVALSLLVHSMILWQLPKLQPQVNEPNLAALQAKLEPLPKLAPKPVTRKPKIHRAPQPTPIAEPVHEMGAEIPASAVEEVRALDADSAKISAVPTTPEETPSHPLLPKHAQLYFAVQYGSGTFKVGEVIHTLENIEGRYSLRAETQTTGVVSIFKNFQLTQTSTGTVTSKGLRPDSYEETKMDNSKTFTSSAHFDWINGKVYFSNGSESPLGEQAQDLLSLPYHVSQLTLNKDSFPIALSNGKSINQYFIAVGEEETISTAMGELRTVPLSKVHGANEDGLIVWLALEYRLLPVKILYLDKSGEISANMVITDIRVSDE